MVARAPGAPQRSERDLLDYLLTHVRVDGDCRPWAGYKCGVGYPRVRHDGRVVAARRLLVSMICDAYGEPLRASERVYSAPGCLHPRDCMALEHLRIGTLRQVRAIAARRGAYLSGAARSVNVGAARAKKARMSMTRRDEVVRLLAEGRNYREIGEVFGVTRSAARQAVLCWRRLGLIAG
jgi:hypothetical protein